MSRIRTEPRLPRSGDAARAAGALIQAALGAELVLAGPGEVIAPAYTQRFREFIRGSPGANSGPRSPLVQTLLVLDLAGPAPAAAARRARDLARCPRDTVLTAAAASDGPEGPLVHVRLWRAPARGARNGRHPGPAARPRGLSGPLPVPSPACRSPHARAGGR